MSALDNNIDTNEIRRCAYLRAMGVDCWIPKTHIQSENIDSNIESGEYSVRDSPAKKKSIDSDIDQSTINIDALTNLNIKQQDREENTNRVEDINLSKPHSKLPDSEVIQNKSESLTNNQTTNRFLKMVSWSNQANQNEESNRLLIVCRHQVEQPANSFARTNSPSLFMLDYIKALETLSVTDQRCDVSLAHLSEAGLSATSCEMSMLLKNNKPDLILILGDETAAHLFGNQSSVANLRGKLLEVDSGYKALVSYHPYTLIKNPSLKRLALADLQIILSYFSIEN